MTQQQLISPALAARAGIMRQLIELLTALGHDTRGEIGDPKLAEQLRGVGLTVPVFPVEDWVLTKTLEAGLKVMMAYEPVQ